MLIGLCLPEPKDCHSIFAGQKTLPTMVNPLSDEMLACISLQAAITLTEWSERTLRRRLAEGSISCAAVAGNKNLISLESIGHAVCIPLSDDTVQLIMRADSGEAEAQTDLAMLFLAHDKPKSAVYWLEQAAKQNCLDAMHWLGLCHLSGVGLAQDDNLAVMWIAKAAAQGHAVAKTQMEALSNFNPQQQH